MNVNTYRNPEFFRDIDGNVHRRTTDRQPEDHTSTYEDWALERNERRAGA